MTTYLRYDLAVKPLFTVAMAGLALALLAPVSPAQVRGVPAPETHVGTGRSVTTAPHGHHATFPTPIGVPPVITPPPGFPAPTPIGVPPTIPFPGTGNFGQFGNGFHHHHHRGFFGPTVPVFVPVPIEVPVLVEPYPMYTQVPDDDTTDDSDVVAGPTVFDRRQPGEMSDAVYDAPPAAPAQAAQPAATQPISAPEPTASSQPQEPQPASVLVFRDGHQLEVSNYAIVGNTLYDFTPGHARKVPLAALDLDATVKANDDRGLDFVLPASVKAD